MSIDLKKIKPNIPQVALDQYFFTISGVPKSGKTTLFAKIVEEYYDDINNGLIIAFEKGYQALKVNAVDINEWDDFEEVVEQLVEDKNELPFKLLALDTVDVLWEMAQQETIREWNMKNPTKRTTDIAGVGAKGKSDSGYGVGYQTAKQKVRKNIDKLMKAGYGIFAITHSKDKEVEEKSGLTYDQLVVSLPNSAREIFVNLADFIIFITIEKEKNENNIETKRYIYWRTDGYVEAGSRFKNVPNKIEYDIKNFINVFENAVRSEFEENTDISKLAEQQKQEKEEKVKEYLKNNETIEEVIEKIKVLASEKRDAGIEVTKINKVVGNLKFKDVKEAKGVLKELEELI